MRGSITRKGTRWYVITEGARDPATGKRKRLWHSGFATKREAEAGLVEILGRIQDGTYVKPSKKTVSEFLDEWLEATQHNLRDSTRASYAATIRNHIQPHIGTILIQQLGPGDLNRLYSSLLRTGRRDGKGGLSPRSVRYVYIILRSALGAAVRWNLIPRNPADASDPPKSGRGEREMRTWTPSEVRDFLQATDDHPHNPVWRIALLTGMRRGELLGLRWRDVDLDNRTISIQQTLVSIEYQIRFSKPKTNQSRRQISIDGTATSVLRSHRRSQAEDRLALGAGYVDHDLVFCQPDGSPWHPDRFSKVFVSAIASSAVPRIRFHDLRHTHATVALGAGVHPKVVSERLGHSSIAVTLDTYSHVMPGLQTEAAETIAAAFIS